MGPLRHVVVQRDTGHGKRNRESGREGRMDGWRGRGHGDQKRESHKQKEDQW